MLCASQRSSYSELSSNHYQESDSVKMESFLFLFRINELKISLMNFSDPLANEIVHKNPPLSCSESRKWTWIKSE
jgi:hypothetical protein